MCDSSSMRISPCDTSEQVCYMKHDLKPPYFVSLNTDPCRLLGIPGWPIFHVNLLAVCLTRVFGLHGRDKVINKFALVEIRSYILNVTLMAWCE